MTRRFLSISREEREALLDAQQSRFLENLGRKLDAMGPAQKGPAPSCFFPRRERPLQHRDTHRPDCLRPAEAADRQNVREKVKTAEWVVWRSMKARCRRLPRYAGRAIAVCPRWMSFENFLSDMGPRPSLQHSIERLDINGDYSPENCVWATRSQQSRNKSISEFLDWRGQRVGLADIARETGLRHSTIRRRLALGLPIEEAVAAALQVKDRSRRGSAHGGSKLTEQDVKMIRSDPRSLGALALAYGVSKTLISQIRTRRIWRHI